MDEWQQVPFSEAVLINPSIRLKNGEKYPFIDMASIEPALKRVFAKEEREFTGGGSRFRSGDTLMARITPCLENGKIGQFSSDDPDTIAYGSTEFIVVRGKPTVSETDFAYYLIKWEHVRNYAIGQMTGTSGRQRVPANAFTQLMVPLPSLPEQRAIASTLGALDDKIDLNRRMNETLEAMARAIFKDWFVDFGPIRAKAESRPPYLAPDLWALFPDALDDENKPVGWNFGLLSNVADAPHRGINPGEVSDETPYIGLEHMPRRSISLAEWEGAGKVSSNKSVFKKGEFLFGKLRPYFHKVGIAPIDGICSTDIVVVKPKTHIWSAYVISCISTDDFVDYTNQTSTGTKMPRTSWSEMGRYAICLPSVSIVNAFQGMIQPMIDKIIGNIHENKSLANTRNLLLPKLMAGEIRLCDAEKVVEAVA